MASGDAPRHVEESVAAIAELHAAHYREAGALQKFVTSATAAVGRPRTLALIALAIVAWFAANLGLPAFGRPAPDPFPFHILAAVASTLDLFLAAMILVAQRHDDELADRRDQLTLEIAILSEQKTAKIIALLEEFRRNDPHQSDGRDRVRRGAGAAIRSTGAAGNDRCGAWKGGERRDETRTVRSGRGARYSAASHRSR